MNRKKKTYIPYRKKKSNELSCILTLYKQISFGIILYAWLGLETKAELKVF